jgi:hypothetical protein
MDEMQKKLREAKLACKEAERDAEQLRQELEVEKRVSQRSTNRQAKTDDNFASLSEKAEELENQLDKERAERQKAQKDVDRLTVQLDTVRETERQPKFTKSDEKVSEFKKQLEEVKKELATEKRDRQKAEKALQKEQTSWEAQKSLLDDKLNQFRSKLRSTKEKLRETEEQLEKAQSAPAPKQTASEIKVTEIPAKKSRKRAAPQLDTENIGTPGNEPPAKRGKRATGSLNRSMPGEKSTFSITPFLNRTMIAPETPEQPTKELQDAGEASQEKDNEAAEDTPSAAPAIKESAPSETKKEPLTQAASRKHNAKVGRKSAKAPSLEKVTEEASEDDTKPAEPSKHNDPQLEKPKLKPMTKSRKSILDFQSYAEEPVPEKRKKRKLAGTAKTLFDEEEDKLPAKPIPGRGLFGVKGMSRPLFGAKKGPMVSTTDGFQFSPLKRDRRAASVNATTIVQ